MGTASAAGHPLPVLGVRATPGGLFCALRIPPSCPHSLGPHPVRQSPAHCLSKTVTMFRLGLLPRSLNQGLSTIPPPRPSSEKSLHCRCDATGPSGPGVGSTCLTWAPWRPGGLGVTAPCRQGLSWWPHLAGVASGPTVLNHGAPGGTVPVGACISADGGHTPQRVSAIHGTRGSSSGGH